MQSTIQYIKKELEGIYPDSEIQGLTKIILEWATGWNYSQQMVNRETQLEDTLRQKIDPVIERLKKFEPIQYILGETEFFGLKINVSPAVLIPRPETEELVKLVLEKNNKHDARILDVGTGSGCIALALKHHLKDAEVSGVDISEMALEVAQKNAKLNKLQVNFFKANILCWQDYNWENYDIIVSNPPYIKESEKAQMQRNVLDFEPEEALFVPDENPLVFYQRILEFTLQKLNKNGSVFFEINENTSNEMYDLFNSFGFKSIKVFNDINEKKRMICGSK